MKVTGRILYTALYYRFQAYTPTWAGKFNQDLTKQRLTIHFCSLEALQIHDKILKQRRLSSRARAKFSSGLKPDITDGWLLRYDDNQVPSLRTPEDKVLAGDLFEHALNNEFKMGDDLFVLVDLLMELKKEEVTDVDK